MLNHLITLTRTGLGLNLSELEAIFQKHNFSDYKFISTQDIIVAPWVRMRCTFGCQSYGKSGCCPPNVPSVDECREFFASYKTAVIFHLTKQVEKPEERIPWSRETNKELLKVEREVFLAGIYKAFLLFMDECRLCSKCTGSRVECRNPTQARPSPESFAVDVFGTVRKQGYPLDVLSDYDKTMNRYAFLMIE